MRILVFGDSITEGFNDNEMGGWVNRLKVFCWQKNNGIDVANLGIESDETVDIIRRLEKTAYDYTWKYTPETKIIFAIGINDTVTNKEGKEGITSIDKFENNLEKMLELSRQFTNGIIFISLTKVNENLVTPFPWSTTGKCYNNNLINKYNEVLSRFCEKEKLQYLDIFGLLNDSDLDDGIHPSSKGHEKIFNEVVKFLKLI